MWILNYAHLAKLASPLTSGFALMKRLAVAAVVAAAAVAPSEHPASHSKLWMTQDLMCHREFWGYRRTQMRQTPIQTQTRHWTETTRHLTEEIMR